MEPVYLNFSEISLQPYGLWCSDEFPRLLEEYADTHSFLLEGENSDELCEHYQQNYADLMRTISDNCEYYRTSDGELMVFEIFNTVPDSMILPQNFSGPFICNFEKSWFPSEIPLEIFPSDECLGVQECVETVTVDPNDIQNNFGIVDELLMIDVNMFCEGVFLPNLVERIGCLERCQQPCIETDMEVILGEYLWKNYETCSSYREIGPLCDFLPLVEATNAPTPYSSVNKASYKSGIWFGIISLICYELFTMVSLPDSHA